jgi:hypothetical protein
MVLGSGVKKAPDPGSYTILTLLYILYWSIFTTKIRHLFTWPRNDPKSRIRYNLENGIRIWK